VAVQQHICVIITTRHLIRPHLEDGVLFASVVTRIMGRLRVRSACVRTLRLRMRLRMSAGGSAF